MAIFMNQAQLTYNGGFVNSNITIGELLETLSVTKTALREQYKVGQTITYVISILNTGSSVQNNLTVRDDLGGYLFEGNTLYPLTYEEGTLKYFVNGVLQNTPAVAAGAPLEVFGVSVPAGGNALLIYEATVNQFASPSFGATIINTATVTGEGIVEPIMAEETVTAQEGIALSIIKSLFPTSVVENDTITYNFLIQNAGNSPATATDSLVITDMFAPALSGIAVRLNGVLLASPAQYSYNEQTGAFSTVAGIITVPAATFVQNPVTGQWQTDPGSAVLEISGMI